MTKQLVLGAFEILGPTFLSNAWNHPDSQTAGFTTLRYWQDLARLLDRGGFDFLFFAEALGYPMSSAGASEVALREGVQFPVMEPLSIITGLAATVDRLGFVVTASTTAERPYTNARRFSTVDHLTDGRIGWNIVTSDNQAAMVKLLGEPGITPHDERYRRAEEFVDLSLKLWEGSWEDGALVMNKETRELVDLAKLHEIEHHGEHFDLEGYFPIPPSPQRTPTLFQAGASSKGKDFAAKYAECVFIQENTVEKTAQLVAELRARAAGHGRSPSSIRVINGLSVVIGDTAEQAQQYRSTLTTTPSREAMGALFLGWSGVDLLALDPQATLSEIHTEVGQSLLAQYQDPDLTVLDVLDRLRETMGGVKVTGTAEAVANQIEEIISATDVDGFLIEHSVGGVASYTGFVEQVMPLLRRRGLLPDQPRRGTLREMLTGGDARLPTDHPGSAYVV